MMPLESYVGMHITVTHDSRDCKDESDQHMVARKEVWARQPNGSRGTFSALRTSKLRTGLFEHRTEMIREKRAIALAQLLIRHVRRCWCGPCHGPLGFLRVESSQPLIVALFFVFCFFSFLSVFLFFYSFFLFFFFSFFFVLFFVFFFFSFLFSSFQQTKRREDRRTKMVAKKQGRGDDPTKKGRGRPFNKKGGGRPQARREGRPPNQKQGIKKGR